MMLDWFSLPTGLLFGDWRSTVLALWIAVLLDWWLGEPWRYHPLVGFGCYLQRLERYLNRSGSAVARHRLFGVIAWSLAVLPLTLVSYYLADSGFAFPFAIVVLYAAIGHRSLHDHVLPVAEAMEQGDEPRARYHASMLVSRDPAEMDIAKSTVESTLENGSDGVFAALFWFVIAGAPGALLYRLANTLDASWGYKTKRFLHFGWAAARLDDLLNYLPARLTALSYASLGNSRPALHCWRTQASACGSPNGGPVMTAGAGALNVSVGGPTCYQGQWLDKPVMGQGPEPKADDIRRSLTLVRHSVLLWLAVLFCISVLEVLLA